MTGLRPHTFVFLLSVLSSAQAEVLSGRVVRVTDGDTIVVLDADKVQHKIRLQGIDAPERGQAFGTKFKEHLSELVAGKTAVEDYSKYDRYRLPACSADIITLPLVRPKALCRARQDCSCFEAQMLLNTT